MLRLRLRKEVQNQLAVLGMRHMALSAHLVSFLGRKSEAGEASSHPY